MGMRQQLSRDPLVLAQVERDGVEGHRRSRSAFQGFVNGWFDALPQPWVVDQHQNWMLQLQLLQLIDPHSRVLVCVRELGQVWGSIEEQYRRKLPLDFPNSFADLSPLDRAERLFGEGMVGEALRSLEAIQDHSAELQSRLYYVVFEHLISNPQEVIQDIYNWLALPAIAVDSQDSPISSAVNTLNSNTLHASLEAFSLHAVPPRIHKLIQGNFRWYYNLFYPGLLSGG
jgi:sulfotransferase